MNELNYFYKKYSEICVHENCRKIIAPARKIFFVFVDDIFIFSVFKIDSKTIPIFFMSS